MCHEHDISRSLDNETQCFQFFRHRLSNFVYLHCDNYTIKWKNSLFSNTKLFFFGCDHMVKKCNSISETIYFISIKSDIHVYCIHNLLLSGSQGFILKNQINIVFYEPIFLRILRLILMRFQFEYYKNKDSQKLRKNVVNIFI